MSAANASMSATQWILLLTLSLVWGGSYFFVGVAVDDLPPLTIVLCRVGFASIALLIFLACSGQSMPTDRRVWAAFFIMGLLNNAIPFSLIVWGQTHVSAGQASILNATTPIFTVIAAHVFTRDEKMKWRHLAGIALGFAGVVVLMGAAFLDAFTSSLLAQTALLGAAVFYALSAVFGRRFRQLGVAPMQIATGQVTAAALLLLPLVVLIDQPLQLAPPGLLSILAVLGLALISTAFAYVLYFRILASADATNLSLVTMLVPPTAICLGILFLDEVLARHHLVGLVLIISGLLVMDGRLAAFRRDKG
jgi:drug/metabolite transporter (DMT)-like permease